MTEKIARRGVFVPSEYTADFLSLMLVRDVASREVVSLPEHLTLAEVRSRIAQGQPGSDYQGFPVLNHQRPAHWRGDPSGFTRPGANADGAGRGSHDQESCDRFRRQYSQRSE